STAVASTMIRPAPPVAREPRCTRCQSPAKPSSAEYWHIGETPIRFRSSTPRNRIASNNIVAPPGSASARGEDPRVKADRATAPHRQVGEDQGVHQRQLPTVLDREATLRLVRHEVRDHHL